MAVTVLKETFGRQYTSAATGQSTATKVYCVITNSDYDELTDLVRDAVTAGLPDLGDAFGADSGETNLVVTQNIPKEIEKELRYFNIEVRYESNQIVFQTPTNRIWDIRFSSVLEEYTPEETKFSTESVYTDSAYTGPVRWRDVNEPLVNTAGSEFDPPVVDSRTKVKISLTKNFASIGSIGTVSDIADLMSFTNSVNDDTVTIAGLSGAAYSFWIEDIQAQNTVADGFNYYAVTFTIIYDPDLHITKVLNTGWMEVVPGDVKNTRPITLKGGGNISSPLPLDINGFKVKGDTPALRRANAIYLGFGIKPPKDFSILSLPNSFNFS